MYVYIIYPLLSGYLMSARDTNAHPSTYECVDANPEYILGHSSNLNGALFYFIKADCFGTGALSHCPPYTGSKELTCVVCSR